MKKNRQSIFSKILNLHWPLILLIVIMSVIGFAMLYSAAEGNIRPWAIKQIYRFAIFFPIMLTIALIDIKFWIKSSYVIYIIALFLLILVEIVGATAMGATRWIKIGPFTLQPSEMMKVCIVFALARYFHSMHSSDIGRNTPLVIPTLLIVLPVILILKQPDLGTAFIILVIGGMLFFVAGVQLWKFGVVFGLGLVSIPFIWQHMHDYQKKRVLTFLNPEDDPLGDGYNILQSKIAIGSGGFSGKGFLKGTQSQLSFLPEKQTDFIFTMLSEEFGLIGGIAIILIYTAIIAYGFFIALSCRNHFGRLMAIGITSIVFLHVFINIAMAMGMIPIVGAPLPLLSYGGTIMVTILTAFGLLLNVHLHSDQKLERNFDRL